MINQPPLVYVGEAFQSEDGQWWRRGKLGPFLLQDRLDTSGHYVGTANPLCSACARGVDHSKRRHRLAQLEGRKKAICTPPRVALSGPHGFRDQLPD